MKNYRGTSEGRANHCQHFLHLSLLSPVRSPLVITGLAGLTSFQARHRDINGQSPSTRNQGALSGASIAAVASVVPVNAPLSLPRGLAYGNITTRRQCRLSWYCTVPGIQVKNHKLLRPPRYTTLISTSFLHPASLPPLSPARVRGTYFEYCT